MFGSQESVGELNGFVEIVVFINCHSENQRALKHELHRLWIPTVIRPSTCLRVTLSEISGHVQNLHEVVAAEFSFVNNTSEMVFKRKLRLAADDKWLSHKHMRKYIKSFYLPFVVSVIWAIHKSLRHCLSPLETECSDCVYLHLQISGRSKKRKCLLTFTSDSRESCRPTGCVKRPKSELRYFPNP